MAKFEAEAALYTTDMQVAISLDAAKAAWTAPQWRTWYMEEVEGAKDYTLTRKEVFGILGIVKGKAVMDAIRTINEDLADQMKVSEGGVNINHPDFATMVASLVGGGTVTQAEADSIGDLAKQTASRNVLKKLPAPREAILIPAVQGLS